MYTKIVLTDDEEYMMDSLDNYVKYKFFLDNFVAGVFINVFSFNPLEEELKKVEMSDFLKESKKYIESTKIEDNSNRLNVLNKLSLKSINSIITSADFIELRFKDKDYNQYLSYINNNRLISNKRIIIDESIELNDFNKINTLLKQFSGLEDNIFVKLEYNTYDPVSLNGCLKTMNIIKEITDRINNYDLSQLEKIMYVYDLVKSKKQNKENQTESPGASRDLTSVLNGDKITNEGYCNLFSAVLNSLGIETKIDKLRDVDNKRNHTRIAINIDDEKYNVKGLYFFDPTNDSVKTKYDNLYNYSSFARTKNQIDSKKMIYDFEHKYKDAPTSLKLLMQSIDKNKDKNLFRKMDEYNWITKLCTFTNSENINIKQMNDETIKNLNKLFSKINRLIPNETMIKLVYNVRYIEHLENSKISYSIETIKLISQISGWKVSFNQAKIDEEKFYKLLSGIDKNKRLLIR